MWSKDYIYEFVGPDYSTRGVVLIMFGVLYGLVCLILSSSLLLLAIWDHKHWLPLALVVSWTTLGLLDEVPKLYKACSG